MRSPRRRRLTILFAAAITATAPSLTVSATPAQADIEACMSYLEGQGIATGPIGCVFGSNGDIEACKGLIASFAPNDVAEEACNRAAAA
ncbi:hypothetical protein [Nonomuraea sp. KM90]|uniref:hypothetical protein n=1 Tax=Nonomuraea sp. KM90 TaxID=3457428 RepID=UPI003FCEB9DE